MQQHRALQHYQNARRATLPPEPNRQFILDLQAWIQHIQEQDHHIMLNLDNNDNMYLQEGYLHPLPYDPESHMPHTSHNGSLHFLAVTCGLIDILAVQHSQRPFPPTYVRGKKRLDYMLVSASLTQAVIRSGILPYQTIFPGDHRPCFVDFDATLLFGHSTTPFAPSCQRSLQIMDPRKVQNYKDALHKQLQYHKVQDKLSALLTAAKNQPWSSAQITQYEKLDKIITESMLHAEKAAGQKYTKVYEWSPVLIQSVEAVRFWRSLLKRSKGLKICQATIERLH